MYLVFHRNSGRYEMLPCGIFATITNSATELLSRIVHARRLAIFFCFCHRSLTRFSLTFSVDVDPFARKDESLFLRIRRNHTEILFHGIPTVALESFSLEPFETRSRLN